MEDAGRPRIQVNALFSAAQLDALNRYSQESGVAKTEIIRRAVAAYLAARTTPGPSVSAKTKQR